MDFDSPDVEKDFPGLYASESGTSRKKDEDDCKCINNPNIRNQFEDVFTKINNCFSLFAACDSMQSVMVIMRN